MGSSELDYDPPIPLVRELLREYALQLGIDLSIQKFEEELTDLPGRYAAPEGCLLIASIDSRPAGCGAFRRIDSGICEMKRLYVRPEFRGHALGKTIVQALMTKAEESGYQAMRLDTLASMQSAIAVYRSLGYFEIKPYYRNAINGSLFFEATLQPHALT